MRRLTAILVGLCAGVITGAVITLTIQDTTAAPPPSPTAPTTQSSVEATALSEGLLLAWSPGALPAGVTDTMEVGGGVGTVVTVRAGLVRMTSTTDPGGALVSAAPPEMAYPLDVIAVDPARYAALLPGAAKSSLGSLADGAAILGSTSAKLRGIGAGGAVHLEDGQRLAVVGVVDDGLVGAAEAVVTKATGERLGITTPRYLLATYRGPRSDAEDALRRLFSPDTPVRFRAPGETPYLRHADAVLPQALIKERFGEFAYRVDSGRGLALDPEWVSVNIASEEVPILGRVRCHRAILPPLRAALSDLAKRNLAHLIDPDAFAGCWNPRRIDADGEELSHHAWGVALDVNWAKNPTGLGSVQDERLVSTLERYGFTWGGEWLVPDPAHFEYLRQ